MASAAKAQGAAQKKAHNFTKLYLIVYVALVVVALLKVLVFRSEGMQNFLLPAILILTAIKFALVVLYYMHVKFDHWLTRALMITGLVMAIGSYLAVGAIILQ